MAQLTLFPELVTEKAKIEQEKQEKQGEQGKTEKASKAKARKAPQPATVNVAPAPQELPKDRDWLVCYAGHRIPIKDKSLSLEDIRQRLERDFPELSAERVVWHWVPPQEDAPQAEKAGGGREAEGQEDAGREEAEGNTPEKPPLILVPVVTAGKKGARDALSRAVRGYYWSVEEMLADPRPVHVLAARDGYYEVRTTPVGVFSRRAEEPLAELDEWEEGVQFALPKIPLGVLWMVREVFRRALPNEALLMIYWDPGSEVYFLVPPDQKATACSVEFRRPPVDGWVWVMDIHSHGLGRAYFSATDDADEKATGLYAVMGRVDSETPEFLLRYSCGGKYGFLDIRDIFEMPAEGER